MVVFCLSIPSNLHAAVYGKASQIIILVDGSSEDRPLNEVLSSKVSEARCLYIN